MNLHGKQTTLSMQDERETINLQKLAQIPSGLLSSWYATKIIPKTANTAIHPIAWATFESLSLSDTYPSGTVGRRIGEPVWGWLLPWWDLLGDEVGDRVGDKFEEGVSLDDVIGVIDGVEESDDDILVGVLVGDTDDDGANVGDTDGNKDGITVGDIDSDGDDDGITVVLGFIDTDGVDDGIILLLGFIDTDGPNDGSVDGFNDGSVDGSTDGSVDGSGDGGGDGSSTSTKSLVFKSNEPGEEAEEFPHKAVVTTTAK